MNSFCLQCIVLCTIVDARSFFPSYLPLSLLAVVFSLAVTEKNNDMVNDNLFIDEMLISSEIEM